MRSWWLLALILPAGCGTAPFGTAVPELEAAIAAAQRARVSGPARVQLADRTVLLVSWNRSFIPPAEGERLLRALGESGTARPVSPKARLLGVVVHSDREGTEVAALYARGPGSLPLLDVAGWRPAPALAALADH